MSKIASYFILAFFFLAPQYSWGKDCLGVKPFSPIATQKIQATVARFYWLGGKQENEDVCTASISINAYDVRGREEDAYFCLKPNESQIIKCKTKLNGDDAEITIVPASWIRTWKPAAVREYRFHAYIGKIKDSNVYLDLFSRTLSFNLNGERSVIEGALKTGSGNQADGYSVRTEFLK